MSEPQLFPVPSDAAKRALIDAKKYEEMYRRSLADPVGRDFHDPRFAGALNDALA